MDLEKNRRFLTDLFSGPFRGHAIVITPPWPDSPLGDFLCSRRPVRDWVPHYVARYETMLRYAEAVGDDTVPYVVMTTNTGIFAAAFGCQLHVYDNMPTNACALHAVETATEADSLPAPDPWKAPTLVRYVELAQALRDRLGPDVTLGIPDIQSPFDIAALIWKKESLLVALYEDPDSVKRLVRKCHDLLVDFIRGYREMFPNVNLCHCPTAWAPPELGLWLSEDEVGALSPAMFEAFCLPSLQALSHTFGGLFMHCCAAADHQYASFRKIPRLRGLNRVFQAPGPQPAIDAFSGETVLMQAWLGEKDVAEFLRMARPNTRYLFNLTGPAVEDAKPLCERLLKACGR